MNDIKKKKRPIQNWLNNSFGIEILIDHFPEAYKALPEYYQANPCLSFYIDVHGNLCALSFNDEFLYADGQWVRLGN